MQCKGSQDQNMLWLLVWMRL